MKENYYVSIQILGFRCTYKCAISWFLKDMTERSASMKFYKKSNCNLDNKEYKRHTCMKVRMLCKNLHTYMIILLSK